MCKDNDIIKRRSFTLVSGMRKVLFMHLYGFFYGTRLAIDEGGLLTNCEVEMAGYWPSSFFCVFMDRDGVEVHNLAKENETIIQPS